MRRGTLIDMRGAEVNGLVVLKRAMKYHPRGERQSVRQARWLCQCKSCGSTRTILGQQLRLGRARCEIRCES
jgi:hypothetical protein